MPAKKSTKKVTTKKEIKKTVEKTVKKAEIKKPNEAAKKIVTSTVRTKERETNFNLMNAVAIVAVVIIVAFVAYLASGKNSSTSPTPVKSVPTINYDCNANQNALALLKEKNTIETQDSSYGVFVDSINAQTNTDDSFWIFYVNGEMGMVAPDKYTCKDGDKIEWRFEKVL